MSTSEIAIPEAMLVQSSVIVNPGLDVQLSVDATRAFGPGGTLEVEGAAEAAVKTVELASNFSPQNAVAVIDSHVPGSAHGHDAYTDEAGIVPSVTLLTERLITRWIEIGENSILRPHATFSLRNLRTDARLTRMFTGSDQIVWIQHALMGSVETQFITPVFSQLFSNIFYKGTHPVHDSHSGIWDAVGNPVGVMANLASRPLPVRAVFIDGNALEVCIRLTALNLARFGIQVYIVVDAVGWLPFIPQGQRDLMLRSLQQVEVKFVHSSQLLFD